jgi:enoyl-CoA hydratase/carnithine racemase
MLFRTGFQNLNHLRPRLMSTAQSILINQQENVLFLELNRPKALNSLSLEMCDIVADALLNKVNVPDSKVSAFVMKGSGGKAFCAGYEPTVIKSLI